MDRDKDARGMSALRQELLQSGLTLGMNSSPPESRRKEENRAADKIFSLGNPSMKGGRLGDGTLGPFGEERADAPSLADKASRREAETMSASTTLQYDPRVDTVRAVNHHLGFLGEANALTLQSPGTQSRPYYRQGSVLQQNAAHGGLPTSSLTNDGLQKTFSKDPTAKPQESPVANPKRQIPDHGGQAVAQQTTKSGQRRRTPNAREGKGMMPTASSQQHALQRQVLHQQTMDVRDSKAGILAGSPPQQSPLQQQGPPHQQQALQHQQALQQQSLLHQQQMIRQQVLDPRDSKGMLAVRSPPQHVLQQQVLQQGRHQVLEGREGPITLPPGSPQQQALQQAMLQQQHHQHSLQMAAYQRGYDPSENKVMISGSAQQQALQQQVRHHNARHQQGLESRDSKGMLSVGSVQQQQISPQQARHQQILEPKGMTSTGLSQQFALEQHARHQQALDSRDNKGAMASGPPQRHQPRQQMVSQQQVRQQVLDVRETKGMLPAGSQQQTLQQHNALQQQAIQQALDVRESNGMLPAEGPKQQLIQRQGNHQQAPESRETKGIIPIGSPQEQLLQQHAFQQALDGRESKAIMLAGSSQQALQQQHQQLQQQHQHQQHALHQQVADAREGKGTISAENNRQHSLQQQALHQNALVQQGLESRDSKVMAPPGSPQPQIIQQQALQQVFDSRESKSRSSTGSPKLQPIQQPSIYHQVMDARESKSMVSVGSPQQRVTQQQNPLQKILEPRDSKSPLHHALQQQALQQQLFDARESKVVIPGNSQRQSLQVFQRPANHQHAIQQFQHGGSHQSATQHSPPQGLHLPKAYQGAFQKSQARSTEQLSSSQHVERIAHHRSGNATNQPKIEPVELEATASIDRSSVDRPSPAERPSVMDSVSPKDSVSVAETEEPEMGLKKMKIEESRPSVSPGSVAESKDSVRSGSRRDGDRGSLHPQSQSSGRTSRENMFADLNAEPPPSDGEDDGPPPSDGAQTAAQPESSRTTTEEKKKKKKAVKDPKLAKDGDEADNKKGIKPVKSRARPKGEVMVDPGLDGDGDAHVNGIPATKEDKIKSLKDGLVHVAKKLPKNAHAQFTLGLMHQRSGQHMKAAHSFRQAADVLKQFEEETGQSRGQFLSIVQVHQAQCLLQGTLGGKLGPGKELEKEELEGVISKLRQATEIEPGQACVWSTLGLLLLRSGRIQNAICVLTSLLDLVPGHVDALANLGVAYLHSGDMAHATQCFQSVLEKDKTHPGALINYAALLLRQFGSSFSGTGAGAGPGAYRPRVLAASAAQQCLEAALKEDPKAAHVWANLAAAYSTLGNLARASQCLEQAVKLEPARMSTRYAVAAHRVKDAERSDDVIKDQLEWAANEMASILRDGDFNSIQPRLAWGGLAMVNRAQHESAAAFEGYDAKDAKDRSFHTLQQAIEEDPEDAVQWHQMGLHTLCTLNFSAAQKYFKTAISCRRANPSAWSNLGIALQFSDDPSLAEGVYTKALDLAPQEQAHSILSNLGNLYRQQKNFTKAHEAFKKALDLCPDYAPACNNLGLLLIAEGKWEDAIAMFDRSLRADNYLDAAKSNRMKAIALSPQRQAEAAGATVPGTSLSSQLPLGIPIGHDGVHVPPPSVAAVAVTSTIVHSTPSVESVLREPFPLPSIS